MTTKVCTSCGTTQILSNFYKKKKGLHGVSSWCKECSRSYKQRNPQCKDYRAAKRLEEKERFSRLPEKTQERLNRERLDKQVLYSRTKRGRFNNYKSSARTRQINFSLSFQEFTSFWKIPCTYCKGEVETIGLDRVDNSLGYTLENVTPCCSTCNKMKLHLSIEEFYSHIKRIASHI